MVMREKLIEILRQPIHLHLDADPTEALADYLLDSGVAVPVRCKDCRNYDDEGYCWFWKYETGMSPNEVDADDFCSYGERRTDG